MKRVVIFSPHLDDVVLNCCDHILDWKNKNSKITVVTIFTQFKTNVSINRIKERLLETGFSSLEEQETQRKKEDIKAMQKLDVSWHHWGFVDGGFRIHENTLLYPKNTDLFSGITSLHDSHLAARLEKKFNRMRTFDKVVIPLGIGNNIDHVIVRKAAEKVFNPKQIIYYVDYPYALKPRNWLNKKLFDLIFKRKSIKSMSRRKKEILKIYASQIKLLFESFPNYPEIVLKNLTYS